MSLLAHSTYGTPGFGSERKALLATLDAARLLEIKNAKTIQSELKCSWAEAVRIAIGKQQEVK